MITVASVAVVCSSAKRVQSARTLYVFYSFVLTCISLKTKQKKKKNKEETERSRVPSLQTVLLKGWLLIHLLKDTETRKAMCYVGFSLELTDLEIIGELCH